MPEFTIETCYLLPVYRQETYRAATLEAACDRALADDNWDGAKPDYDCARPAYIAGIWRGRGTAYRGPELPVPTQHEEAAARKDDHFPVMLDILKRIPNADDATRHAIATGEAILAGAPDPE
jgi:hypothetical protein